MSLSTSTTPNKVLGARRASSLLFLRILLEALYGNVPLIIPEIMTQPSPLDYLLHWVLVGNTVSGHQRLTNVYKVDMVYVYKVSVISFVTFHKFRRRIKGPIFINSVEDSLF